MDTLSHGLWGGMIFGWRRRFGLAFLFGVSPDLFSFGLWMFVRVVQRGFTCGKPSLAVLPQWLDAAYSLTHSLVIAGLVFAVLWWKKRDLAVPFSAWIVHILTDIPTHSRAFFPTPFLYPLSDYTFDGFSWGQWWFMLLNYSCLLVLAILWVWSRNARRVHSAYRINLKSYEGPSGGEEPLPGSFSKRST